MTEKLRRSRMLLPQHRRRVYDKLAGQILISALRLREQDEI